MSGCDDADAPPLQPAEAARENERRQQGFAVACVAASGTIDKRVLGLLLLNPQ